MARFEKVLAKYYEVWYRSCHNSIVYCKENSEPEHKIEHYRAKTVEYFNLINENWEDIEFFRVGDNAYLTDSATEQKRMEWQNQ